MDRASWKLLAVAVTLCGMEAMQTMRDTAIDAARSAGRLLLAMAAEGGPTIRHKDGNACNFVTDADLAAEQHGVDAIRQRFPDHAFLAEEVTVPAATVR